MLADPVNLLVVANSGRSIAASAVRGGFRVSVFDGFGDQDTQDLACHWRRISMDEFGLNQVELYRELATSDAGHLETGVVYGAGLENHSGTLRWVSERFRLLGNEPSVFDLVSNPRQFFARLARLEIPFPEIRFQPPTGHRAGWLRKRPGSGGQGVRFFNREQQPELGADAGNCYYQRYLRGAVMSVLFIANGASSRLIGYNSLKQARGVANQPFLYAGAVSMAGLDPRTAELLGSFVDRLVVELGLRGINSLDCIVSQGRAYVIELNPRPSATLELYEEWVPEGWIKHHVQSCHGLLPELPPTRAPALIHGQRIVYLPESVRVPEAMDWPAWCKDRPAPGTLLAKGAALCSLQVKGDTVAQVERCLQQRQREILTAIGCRPRQEHARH